MSECLTRANFLLLEIVRRTDLPRYARRLSNRRGCKRGAAFLQVRASAERNLGIVVGLKDYRQLVTLADASALMIF